MPHMESPEPEDFGPKETFAFFGRAAYYAQVLEQELLIFAVMLHLSGRSRFTRNQVENLFSTFEKRTFGQLFREAARLASIPASLDQKLSIALEKRNYLAHHFFAIHSEDFLSDRGRAKMIEELRHLTDLFAEADAALTEIRKLLSSKLGVTPEVAEQFTQDMLARAKARDSGT